MYFVASGSQVDAMKLLESNGARSDVKDENGRTAARATQAIASAYSRHRVENMTAIFGPRENGTFDCQ